MKARTLLLAAMLLLIISCGKMAPSTYHEQIYRIATVQSRLGQAWLSFDCMEDEPRIKNFKDTTDMKRFDVKDGDRVMVSISFDAEGDMNNCTFTLDEIKKLKPLEFESTIPADTLNNYYEFSYYLFFNFYYPVIWSAGHFVNFSPAFFIESMDGKAEFHIYPTGVSRDTLLMRVYSDIPNAYYGSNSQALLSCDISSIRKPVADTNEQHYRDSLLNILDNLDKDSIFVKVLTPDTLRGISNGKMWKFVSPYSEYTLIPLDF